MAHGDVTVISTTATHIVAVAECTTDTDITFKLGFKPSFIFACWDVFSSWNGDQCRLIVPGHGGVHRLGSTSGTGQTLASIIAMAVHYDVPEEPSVADNNPGQGVTIKADANWSGATVLLLVAFK